MDEKYANAREHFFAAIRTLAASTDSIQTRLIDANVNILHVTIDEFDGDMELKVKFAKILDLLAIDQDDMETVAVETAAHMTDFEAVKVADLIAIFTMSLHRGVYWEDTGITLHSSTTRPPAWEMRELETSG